MDRRKLCEISIKAAGLALFNSSVVPLNHKDNFFEFHFALPNEVLVISNDLISRLYKDVNSFFSPKYKVNFNFQNPSIQNTFQLYSNFITTPRSAIVGYPEIWSLEYPNLLTYLSKPHGLTLEQQYAILYSNLNSKFYKDYSDVGFLPFWSGGKDHWQFGLWSNLPIRSFNDLSGKLVRTTKPIQNYISSFGAICDKPQNNFAFTINSNKSKPDVLDRFSPYTDLIAQVDKSYNYLNVNSKLEPNQSFFTLFKSIDLSFLKKTELVHLNSIFNNFGLTLSKRLAYLDKNYLNALYKKDRLHVIKS